MNESKESEAKLDETDRYIKLPRWARSNERIKLHCAKYPQGIVANRVWTAKTKSDCDLFKDIAKTFTKKEDVKLPHGLKRKVNANDSAKK